MSDKPIVRMGAERLSKASLPVEAFGTKELDDLIKDMQDTMRSKKGVGIAAPQIGCYQRVIMFGFDHSDRYPNEKPVPFTILINPTIEVISTEMINRWEGCLSVPGLRGLVPRHQKIKYTGFDQQGNPVSGVAEGFHARIIQHECDHINGVLFPERIEDMHCFGFEEEVWERVYGVKKL